MLGCCSLLMQPVDGRPQLTCLRLRLLQLGGRNHLLQAGLQVAPAVLEGLDLLPQAEADALCHGDVALDRVHLGEQDLDLAPGGDLELRGPEPGLGLDTAEQGA